MTTSSNKRLFLAVGLVVSTALLLGCRPDEPPAPGETVADGKAVNAERSAVLKEALAIIQKKALFADGNAALDIKDGETLDAYLRRKDSASEYLGREEYATFQASLKSRYIGVGIEIERNQAGEIICFPMAGSPAQACGVESGDVLEAVDGRTVAGYSLYKTASLLMGASGSRVSVTLKKQGGGGRAQLQLTRQPIQSRSVSVEQIGGYPVIEIHDFGGGTKSELKAALAGLMDASVLVLDLRDNHGGDLYKSIDCAMLFLEKDAPILSIQTRDGTHSYKSTTVAFNSQSTVYIWQNENTASAAEVFTAALTENKRAESVGHRSYGKGISQDIFELSDGSALFLTTGILKTPANHIYQQRGLEPTHFVKGDPLTSTDYSRAIDRLIQARRPESTRS